MRTKRVFKHSAQWRKQNRERTQRWRAENPESAKQIRDNYVEYTSAYNRSYFLKNKDRINKKRRACYALKHGGRVRPWKRKRSE